MEEIKVENKKNGYREGYFVGQSADMPHDFEF